jgi:hypothetical protein
LHIDIKLACTIILRMRPTRINLGRPTGLSLRLDPRCARRDLRSGFMCDSGSSARGLILTILFFDFLPGMLAVRLPIVNLLGQNSCIRPSIECSNLLVTVKATQRADDGQAFELHFRDNPRKIPGRLQSAKPVDSLQ